jgi:hypothetical protein
MKPSKWIENDASEYLIDTADEPGDVSRNAIRIQAIKNFLDKHCTCLAKEES